MNIWYRLAKITANDMVNAPQNKTTATYTFLYSCTRTANGKISMKIAAAYNEVISEYWGGTNVFNNGIGKR